MELDDDDDGADYGKLIIKDRENGVTIEEIDGVKCYSYIVVTDKSYYIKKNDNIIIL